MSTDKPDEDRDELVQSLVWATTISAASGIYPGPDPGLLDVDLPGREALTVTRRRRGRRPGAHTHRIVAYFVQLAAAIRHVRTGGASTRARARQRAAKPPRRCTKCGQKLPHSSNPRDHVHL